MLVTVFAANLNSILERIKRKRKLRESESLSQPAESPTKSSSSQVFIPFTTHKKM